MAKRTVIRIVDDIDGKELDEYETVRWSLDGKNYEFDTSPEHADDFRNAVATYVAASRSVGGARQARRGSKSNVDTKAVRAWANANGHPVSDRGRIPANVIAAFEAAN